MERAVLCEQDHATVLALGRDSIADAIREAPRERPDRRVARDVLCLESQAALADEAAAFALDEHRLAEPGEFRVFVFPAAVPAFHERMADDSPGRQWLQGRGSVPQP